MHDIVETDIAIFGGGVAGLWLLNRVRQLGLSAVLFESDKLGGGQTHKAQGIIHGGTKFALQGTLTSAAKAIAAMPAIWNQCLQGQGEIDLTRVPILSSHQYLWSPHQFMGKLAGFFAGLALQGKVHALSRDAFPAFFQHPAFKGAVYALAEMAIDTHALIHELAKPNEEVIFKIDSLHENQMQLDSSGRLVNLEVRAYPGDPVQVKAQKYIFTAGAGNELILKKINRPHLAMQRRSLHMVYVKTDVKEPVFAHCLGAGATPRVTITTHQTPAGQSVWYLGGQLAEEGVTRDPEEQIAAAQKELHALFPWVDLSKATWGSFLVDRAEPLQADGKRPDYPCAVEIENMMVAWPTKLAFAPKLTDDIIQLLLDQSLAPGVFDPQALRSFPRPALAKPIWENEHA